MTAVGVHLSLLYVDGCPHWRVTDDRLRDALRVIGRSDEAIDYRAVASPEMAEKIMFRGSPTVLVDGRDPFLDREAPVGLACRLYPGDDGPAGCPTVDQLVTVLRAAGVAACGTSPTAPLV